MDQYICFNAMQRNNVYYFTEERVNFSPFINTLLRETSKTDRIWTLRCGKRKNILAKQINSALSPRGNSLRKSDAETEPAWSSGQHPLNQMKSGGDPLQTDGKRYYHRDEEDRLHSAAVWGSTLTGFCAHIQSEQISNPLSPDTTQHCLSALCCSQDLYFEMAVKGMVQT